MQSLVKNGNNKSKINLFTYKQIPHQVGNFNYSCLLFPNCRENILCLSSFSPPCGEFMLYLSSFPQLWGTNQNMLYNIELIINTNNFIINITLFCIKFIFLSFNYICLSLNIILSIFNTVLHYINCPFLFDAECQNKYSQRI